MKKSSLVVEVIGPAGAGKSTLLRALSQHHNQIQPGIHPSKTRQLPFLISNTIALLPVYLREYRHSRWFSRREMRSMTYLKAGLPVLRRQALNNGTAIILDHGPIYRLAFLRALGPEITTSQRYMSWWADLFNQWVSTINIIIWLDAPNGILLERIRGRGQQHPIKENGQQDAYEYLIRYRLFLEQIIAESVSAGQIMVLRFDTNQESTEQIIDKVLTVVDFAPETSAKVASRL